MMSEQQNNVADESDISARKKALLLGRMLGLASEDDYRPSTASIAERAQHRQRKLQSHCQANLETIFALALNYSPSDVTGSNLDADWSYQFFQMAEQIHNRKMQDLWARILASEIISPGNFSLRSLAVLKQLTAREALIIEKALGMAAKIGSEKKVKLLSGYKMSGGIKQYFRKHNQTVFPLSQHGLPYSNILTLIDAGILYSSEFETGLLDTKSPLTVTFTNNQFTISPKNPHLLFSYYRFTHIGEELCQLITPKSDDKFAEEIKILIKKDFTLTN
ncbi:TIGR03899 family protein [Shewanella gaetbuli]